MHSMRGMSSEFPVDPRGVRPRHGWWRMLAVVAIASLGLLGLGLQPAAATVATAPVAPVITGSTVTRTTIGIEFTQATPPGQAAITKYEYSMDAGAHWADALRTDSPVGIVGLTPGTDYTLILRAQSDAGPGGASAPLPFHTQPISVPYAPTQVFAIANPDRILVAFDKSDNGGSPFTGHEFSVDAGPWKPVTPFSETNSRLLFELNPLPATGAHNVAVRSLNTLGASQPGGPTNFTATGPTNLVATPHDRAAAIGFTAPPDAGQPVRNYEYSVDGGAYIAHVPPVTSSPLEVPDLDNGVPAEVRIRAVYDSGPGVPSQPVTVTPAAIPAGDPGGVPKKPVLVRVIPDDGSATVVFKTPTAAEAVTNYDVTVDGVEGSPLTPPSAGTPIGATGESYIELHGLTNDTEYHVGFAAMNDAGESAVSDLLTFTPRARPDAPNALTANPGNRSALVGFSPAGAPAAAPVIGYEVSVNDSAWRSVGMGPPVRVSNLANGFTYSLKLRAVNAMGPGPASAPVSVSLPRTPQAPAQISAMPGDGSAQVAIVPGPDGGLPVTRYEYSLDDNDGVPLSPSPDTAVSPITLAHLTNGVPVRIKVRAVNALGAGDWSAPTSVTPGAPVAPSITSVVAAAGQLTVNFTEGANALVPTDHQYSLDGGRSWNAFRSPQPTSPLVIGGLTDGVGVQLAVRSLSGANPGAASGVVRATPGTPPGGIPGLSATEGDGSADMTFTPPAGVVTHYEYSLDSGARVTTAASVGANQVRITGLTNGVAVSIALRAVNDSGPGPWSPPVRVTPGSVPAPPTGLTATAGPGQVSIDFTPGADGGSPITGYEYSVVGVGAHWLPAAGASSPVVITGLEDWQAYRIALRAVSVRGAGVASAPVDVTPAPKGTVFVPTEPARVLDTRRAFGGAGPILPGDANMRTFSVATRQEDNAPVVPAGATAVMYNLTVPNPADGGHLRLMPADSPLVSTSVINFRAGESIANGATAKIDANREIKLYATARADAVIDILGYFVPTGQAPQDPAGGRFSAITPTRVYDAAADANGPLAPGQSRQVSVRTTQDARTQVVPADASAVTYNLTVAGTTAGGHLRVMPGDVQSTGASAINWGAARESIANGLSVKIDRNGQLRIFNGSAAPVRFLVDVTGYYADAGTLFYPIESARVFDSRPISNGSGLIGTGEAAQRTVDVSKIQRNGVEVVPNGAVAVSYNLTAVDTTSGPGHLRIYPADKPLVGASALNWPAAGYTRANGSVTEIGASRDVKIYNGSTPVHALVDILGFYR